MTQERRPRGDPLPFTHYDRRNYETVSVEKGYGIWSRTYGAFDDRFDIDLFEGSPSLTARVPGARVVDFGCGNGRIGKWLRSNGAAAVVGVDRSAEMLEQADAAGVYERTVLADAAATGLPAGSFDGGISSMALCHVADLHAFFEEARRLLRPGAFLALLDYHPYFLFMGIPTHFDPPDGSAPLAIENHVHPVSRLFQAGRAAGFMLREIEERFVDTDWVASTPNYERYLGLPITHMWIFESSE